jgi:hypothetical protein
VDIHCGRAEEQKSRYITELSKVQEITTSPGRLTYKEDGAGKTCPDW